MRRYVPATKHALTRQHEAHLAREIEAERVTADGKLVAVEAEAAAERAKFERLGVELGLQAAKARTNLFHASEAHHARITVMAAKQDFAVEQWIKGLARDTVRFAFARWSQNKVALKAERKRRADVEAQHRIVIKVFSSLLAGRGTQRRFAQWRFYVQTDLPLRRANHVAAGAHFIRANFRVWRTAGAVAARRRRALMAERTRKVMFESIMKRMGGLLRWGLAAFREAAARKHAMLKAVAHRRRRLQSVVGPARYRPPRHRHALEPSPPSLSGMV